ncbi:hypothetical protein ACHAW5_006260 [Stephanodiscus triporus]|uniref:Fe2OG dioxygenase domain-containing protein n=1 Tax=Stephanodiscus triporus TaxID=2934178 RepID=A0ABD3MJN9_9STRA
MEYDSRDNDAKLAEGGWHEEKKEEDGSRGDFDRDDEKRPESSSSVAVASVAWASPGGSSFSVDISNHGDPNANGGGGGGGVVFPASSNEPSDASMQHGPKDPPGKWCLDEMLMREQLRQQRTNVAAARQQLEYGLMTSSLGSMQLDAAHHQQQLQAAAAAVQSAFLGPAMAVDFANPLVAAQIQHHMTIPHYVPPTCATWGAQVPALSVQDRPLVPPIYNGINPNYPGARLLHAHPPIFVVEDFLSHAECDFLIEAASDAFGPAPVVGRGSGEVSPSRTSSTCYLAREDLPEYLRKVGLLTGKPPEHCELPQVGRYLPGERYLQHFDAFDLSDEDGRRFAANGGQRTVTVLVYLNDVIRGGATAFPNLNVEVRPRRGMAVVFFPSTLDGLLDRMALHAALPAVDVKYVSQVWIRQSNYEGRPSKRLPGPMVAGLQEMRDALEQERAMLGRMQLHPQLAQQQMYHQHVQVHNNHAQLHQLQQQGYHQQMEG